MVYFIGASCLHGLMSNLPYESYRKISHKVFTVRGLSFNPKSINKLKILQNLLSKGKLASGKDIVIWHGCISNSISKHRSNNNQSLPVEDLVRVLKPLKNRIKAVIYLQRDKSPNIVKDLYKTGILVLDAKKLLLSRKKARSREVLTDLKRIHPSTQAELRLFNTVLAHEENLKGLVRYRGKKANHKGPGKKERGKIKTSK